VVAIVTQRAVEELGLAPGVEVTALVKAADVVLAVVT
jgi:molybdate transport system regulatory protein